MTTYYFIFTALPTPDTIISAGALPVLGQPYIITCLAVIDQEVSAGLSLALIDQRNGLIIASTIQTETTPMSGSSQTTSGTAFFFQSLDESFQGNYTCVSSVSLPGLPTTTESNATHSLTPVTLSKYSIYSHSYYNDISDFH